jgi:hypothetical protein
MVSLTLDRHTPNVLEGQPIVVGQTTSQNETIETVLSRLRYAIDAQLDQSTLNKRLLNLRRRGEANGGLPRLERCGHNMKQIAR